MYIFIVSVGFSVGINNNKLVEIVEYKNHPYYIGCQYHPEYRSRYNEPHPLFVGLLKSMIK